MDFHVRSSIGSLKIGLSLQASSSRSTLEKKVGTQGCSLSRLLRSFSSFSRPCRSCERARRVVAISESRGDAEDEFEPSVTKLFIMVDAWIIY